LITAGLDPARWLPHGPAFLFVDEVISLDERRIVAARVVPTAEPWTEAHFPGDPIVPGALLLEGMVQTSGILARVALLDRGGRAGRAGRVNPVDRIEPADRAASGGAAAVEANGRLASVRSARFLHAVRPGTRIVYYAELRGRAFHLCHFDARIEVGDLVVAQASVVLAVTADALASPDRREEAGA